MSTFVTLLDLLCSLNEVYWLYRWVDMLFSKRVYLFQSKLLKKGLYPGLFLSYLSVVFILNRVALTSPYTIPILAIINIVFVLAFWESDIAQAVAVIGVYFLVIFVKRFEIMPYHCSFWNDIRSQCKIENGNQCGGNHVRTQQTLKSHT